MVIQQILSGFFNNFITGIVGPSIGGPMLSERNYNIPEKVFVDREGPYYEYSEDEPAAVAKLNNFFQHWNSFDYASLFYCLPEVTSAVHTYAKAVSDANWKMCRFMDDEAIYTDKDFNRLFTQPNPLETMRDLVYSAVVIEILTGRNLFYINRPDTLGSDYRSALSWYNLPGGKAVNAHMKPGLDPYSATELSDYVTKYSMPGRIFPVDKVIPLVHLDICNKQIDLNKTKSLLAGADKAIKNLIAVYDARGSIYLKRGAMGVWVSKKTDASGNIALTPTETKQAAEEVNKDYGVTGNRLTVGLTSIPITFERTTMSIAEMLPFDETLSDAVAIYSVLGMPRSMVPSKDSSTFNNVDADKKEFYTGTIMPHAQKYADLFTNGFKFGDSRRYIKADFSHIGVLQDNRKDKATVDRTNGEVYMQRWLNSVWTLNDWIKAVEGEPGVGRLYETKILDLTPDEIAQVKTIVNFKTVSNVKADTTTEDSGS